MFLDSVVYECVALALQLLGGPCAAAQLNLRCCQHSSPVNMVHPFAGLQSYMEPLVARLAEHNPLDVEVMPALDAIIHLTMSIGGNIEQFAVPILRSSLAVAVATLAVSPPPSAASPPPSYRSQASTHTTPRLPQHPQASSILTFSLDAITALVEVLKGSSAALLATVGADAVLDAALMSVLHDEAAVQQSGLALVGELATHAPATLGTHGPKLLDATFEVLKGGQLTEVRGAPVCSAA
jgi:hypothetical protein